jgi:hypothetical protein
VVELHAQLWLVERNTYRANREPAHRTSSTQTQAVPRKTTAAQYAVIGRRTRFETDTREAHVRAAHPPSATQLVYARVADPLEVSPSTAVRDPAHPDSMEYGWIAAGHALDLSHTTCQPNFTSEHLLTDYTPDMRQMQ